MSDYLQQLFEQLPDEVLSLLRSTIAALVILLLISVLYGFVSRSLAALQTRRKLSDQTIYWLRRFCRWVAYLVTILLVLQQFGLLENAWTTLTAILAMVAIGFVAVWSILSNCLCSLILMIVRPFNVGDTIEIPADGLRGKVIDFNLMFTILRDDEGDMIQIPNNTFFQKAIRRRMGTKTVTLEEQVEKEQPSE